MGKGKLALAPGAADVARLEQQVQQRSEQVATLGGLDCLQHVLEDELERFIDLCTLRAFRPAEAIIHERDQDNAFFIILQGSVRLTLHDKEGREVLLGVLGRGDSFGGGALFGDFFRRSGAYAVSHCFLLHVPLGDLRSLLTSTPSLYAVLQRTYLQRLAEFTLARVPLFHDLSPVERVTLTALLQNNRYPRGSVVVEEGSSADALYLLESGQVVIERQGQAIATLEDGDFFGEMSLLSDQPHSATVRTMTQAAILALPADEFHRLLDQQPGLRERCEEVIKRRRAVDTSLLIDQDRVQRLTIAVQRGLLRGTHLLVRTPALCPPGCRICEELCISRHGYQRLHLNGITMGQYDILDACRQCRVGTECIEACPEDGALEWAEKGVVIVTDKCTGCGDCVPACPYDAVARVPRVRGQTYGPLDTLFRSLKRARNALMQPVIPLEPVAYTHRADKCDLCHGYDDMACVSQCPTGALRLVPVEELFPL
jgi:CRP-like cAMP-binding protein/Fe-S-cluster-containing hydrogenase component 2